MHSCCICVADSDETSAQLLADGLRQNKYEVRVATTPDEVYRECRQGDVHVLVLAAALGDVDGVALARQLKMDQETCDIILLLALDREAQKRFSIEDALGVDDYIIQPHNLPMLMIRIEAALRRRRNVECLKAEEVPLGDTSYTDELTGLRNRRYLLERLQEEVEKAHRYNFPVSCVMFDVSEVEALDEELGTVSLDDLLVELAMAMRNYSRTFDILARYDGTVFAAVLPHVDRDQAVQYAQKILNEVENTTFADPCYPSKTRLSAGIVACKNGSARSAEAVLGEAMQSLLAAQSARDKRVGLRDLSDGP
ncbi:MAG: GGDEF domain-containing protein [Candidatus Hydrogenedentales bacterium]